MLSRCGGTRQLGVLGVGNISTTLKKKKGCSTTLDSRLVSSAFSAFRKGDEKKKSFVMLCTKCPNNQARKHTDGGGLRQSSKKMLLLVCVDLQTPCDHHQPR